MHCSVARTLEIAGEWWTFLILRDLFKGVRRFDDMQRNTGIARNILSDRLRTLVEHGIIERRRYQERPERFEYRLTEKGIDLYPVIIALMRWGDRWELESPPVVLTHKGCGHDVMPQLTCPDCGDQVGARDMRWRPNADVEARAQAEEASAQRGRREAEEASAAATASWM
jgi:DNA-binding HxlR family transcriptional regulator